MVVEDVIGYAQAPWVMWVSTQTTVPAPSEVVGIPGNCGFACGSARIGYTAVGVPLRTVLIWPLLFKKYEAKPHGQNPHRPTATQNNGGNSLKNCWQSA